VNKASTDYGHKRILKGRSPSGRGNNGAKRFTVVHDPADVFSAGAVLSALDIQCGLHEGVFMNGISFDTSLGRLRVDRGALVYAKNRAKYKMSEPHIWK